VLCLTSHAMTGVGTHSSIQELPQLLADAERG
jgi:hypothetical protein